MFQEVLIARFSLVVVFIRIPRDWLIYSLFSLSAICQLRLSDGTHGCSFSHSQTIVDPGLHWCSKTRKLRTVWPSEHAISSKAADWLSSDNWKCRAHQCSCNPKDLSLKCRNTGGEFCWLWNEVISFCVNIQSIHFCVPSAKDQKYKPWLW
jgi:hypothetical protein